MRRGSNSFRERWKMVEILKKFEQMIVYALIGMMILVILLATLDLAWIIVKDVVTAPILLLKVQELNEIFGFFLLVLIGIELLETIKAYLAEKVVHVEIVVEVALIAIARKVIILDLKDYESLTVIGIAALIMAVAVAIYTIKRFHKSAG